MIYRKRASFKTNPSAQEMSSILCRQWTVVVGKFQQRPHQLFPVDLVQQFTGAPALSQQWSCHERIPSKVVPVSATFYIIRLTATVPQKFVVLLPCQFDVSKHVYAREAERGSFLTVGLFSGRSLN